MILMLKKTPGITTYSALKHSIPHDSIVISYIGTWNVLTLHETLTGMMAMPESSLSFKFQGNTLILLFWVHAWSGHVSISINSNNSVHNLYSDSGGFKRVVFDNLSNEKEYNVTIMPTGTKDDLSMGDQIIFFSASCYTYI
jgi:hypothetical protein